LVAPFLKYSALFLRGIRGKDPWQRAVRKKDKSSFYEERVW